jgi:hypothetical protein
MGKIARCPFLLESVCIERVVTDKILNMPSIPGGARFLSIATPLLALPSSFSQAREFAQD